MPGSLSVRRQRLEVGKLCVRRAGGLLFEPAGAGFWRDKLARRRPRVGELWGEAEAGVRLQEVDVASTALCSPCREAVCGIASLRC